MQASSSRQQIQQSLLNCSTCTAAAVAAPVLPPVLLRAGARGRVVASVRPAVGLALLHLHGEDRCLEHEANVVVQGTKYVLRSDIVFGPPEA